MFPIDPMAILAIAHDVVLTRIDAELTSRRPAFYVCENCCCVFWPDVDDDAGSIYPDRFTHVGEDGPHCDADQDCGCHNFPYSTRDGFSDTFLVSRPKVDA